MTKPNDVQFWEQLHVWFMRLTLLWYYGFWEIKFWLAADMTHFDDGSVSLEWLVDDKRVGTQLLSV